MADEGCAGSGGEEEAEPSEEVDEAEDSPPEEEARLAWVASDEADEAEEEAEGVGVGRGLAALVMRPAWVRRCAGLEDLDVDDDNDDDNKEEALPEPEPEPEPAETETGTETAEFPALAALIPELPAALPFMLPPLPWRAAVPASNRALDPVVVTDDPPPTSPPPPPSAANPPGPPPTPLIPLPPKSAVVWVWAWDWCVCVACVRVAPAARPLTRSNMAGTVSSSPPGCGGMATDVVAMSKNMIRPGKSRSDDNPMRSYSATKMRSQAAGRGTWR